MAAATKGNMGALEKSSSLHSGEDFAINRRRFKGFIGILSSVNLYFYYPESQGILPSPHAYFDVSLDFSPLLG